MFFALATEGFIALAGTLLFARHWVIEGQWDASIDRALWKAYLAARVHQAERR